MPLIGSLFGYGHRVWMRVVTAAAIERQPGRHPSAM